MTQHYDCYGVVNEKVCEMIPISVVRCTLTTEQGISKIWSFKLTVKGKDMRWGYMPPLRYSFSKNELLFLELLELFGSKLLLSIAPHNLKQPAHRFTQYFQFSSIFIANIFLVCL